MFPDVRSLDRHSNRVFFLRNQPNAHRIPIVFAAIGSDSGDDDDNQAEDYQTNHQKNTDKNEN
jgi:hypothetical protein